MRKLCCITLLFTAVLVALMVDTVHAGKPGSGCSGNTPLSWSFLDPASAPAALMSDGRGTYVQGADGVANSLIQELSFDATISIPGPGRKGTGRSIQIRLPQAIPGSIIEGGPAMFAGGTSFQTNGQMNIRNILGRPVIPRGVAATYYTKASGTFVGPDGKDYRWGSTPSDFTCPVGFVCVPNSHLGEVPNAPQETGWVKITYIPADSVNLDRWLVEGEFFESGGVVQRTTLLQLPSRSTPSMHYGQYSMPFAILITALCPLPDFYFE